MQKIIKISPIVSEKNSRTDGHTHTRTHGHTHRQGSNYRPIFVPKDRSKTKKCSVGGGRTLFSSTEYRIRLYSVIFFFANSPGEKKMQLGSKGMIFHDHAIYDFS